MHGRERDRSREREGDDWDDAMMVLMVEKGQTY